MYRHFPLVVERNPLFRFLFLLRKVFLIKSSRRHYSQFGEDVALENLLQKRHKGLYVDVGCFHPTKYSNTYRLYQRGWRGVNIDMDDIKIQAFKLRRPRDTNITRAITDNPNQKSVTMYSFGYYTLLNTLDKQTADSLGGYIEKEVAAATLSQILDEQSISKVDVLSVDAEGYDINVLRSIDFSAHQISVILVEQHTKNLRDVLETEVFQCLRSKSYDLVNWTGPTLIFEKSAACKAAA